MANDRLNIRPGRASTRARLEARSVPQVQLQLEGFGPAVMAFRIGATLNMVAPLYVTVFTSSASARHEALRAEFDALATRWHAETQHCSMTWQYVLHDAYQRIVVGMGKDALPLILEDLRDHGGYWFDALEIMAGEDPAASATSRTEAIGAWLAWGRRHGHIQ